MMDQYDRRRRAEIYWILQTTIVFILSFAISTAIASSAAVDAKGSPTWSVNKLNMNLYVTDIPIWYTPPYGPPIEIQLSYNSKANADNAPFGKKWMLNYGSYIKAAQDGSSATVFMPDGSKNIYTFNSQTGTYVKPYGIFDSLTKTAPDTFTLAFLDGTVFTYRIPGIGGLTNYYLAEIRDAYNNKLTLTYAEDSNHNIISLTITPSASPTKQVVLHFDTNGHVQSVTGVNDPLNRHADFVYSGDDLFSIKDMAGYITEFTYEGNSYLKTMKLKPNNGTQSPTSTWNFKIEPDDGITSNPTPYPEPSTPMGKNYRVTITDPLGNKEEYYYYAGIYSWHVSPNDYIEYSPGHNNYTSAPKTKFYFDTTTPKLRLMKTEYPGGGYTKYSNYDPATGKPRTIKDYHGEDSYGSKITHLTYYTYNANGLVTKIIDARGKPTDITYKANNIDVWKITNPLGSIELDYNNSHDVTSIKDRLNNTTTLEYETNGQLKKINQPLGLTTELVYNLTTRYLTDIKKGGSVISSFTYDSTGRMQTQTGTTGVTTTYEYNNLDKVTKVTFPDTKYILVNRSTHHPNLIDTITDRNGLVTTYIHNALNQLTEVQGPMEGAANSYIYDYRYDKNGNRWKIIDMMKTPAAETVFEYDKDDNTTKKTYADSKFVTYTYDKMGQPKTFTNARNITTTYAFDPNHNLTNITYSDATPAVILGYDDYNRMTKRTDGTGVTDFTYRADDKLETVDGPLTGDKLTYHYNALGNLIDITPEQGQVVSYKYDYDTGIADTDLGRLKSITTGSNTYTYDYDGVNPLIRKLTRPNGSYTDYEYNDPLKRLTALINKTSTGSLINSFAYTYDKDLIKTETITNGTIIDNFLEKTTSYQTNAVNQLLSATTQGVAKNYVYDNDGNMTTGYTPEGYALAMTYDAQNRMKTAQYTDGTGKVNLFEYAYAGNSFLDQLVKKENGTPVSTTKYLRSGFLPVQERDGSNSITREYTWGKNLGGGIGGLLNLKQNNQDYSYLYDGKGNVTALVDANQIPVATYAYDPFGQLMKKSGTLDQPYTFSTKEAQAGTGQYYYGYRFYDSCSGKWSTRDPLGEAGGMNLYQFVKNNAVNKKDPLGLMDIDPSEYYNAASAGMSSLGAYGQGGFQLAGHYGLAGISVAGGAIGGAGARGAGACFYVTACLRVGPGIYGGGGYTYGGGLYSGSVSNLSGLSVGLGGDIGTGVSYGGQATVGVNNDGISSAGFARGKGGAGAGLSAGVDICWTEVRCKESCTKK